MKSLNNKLVIIKVI